MSATKQQQTIGRTRYLKPDRVSELEILWAMQPAQWESR